MIAMYKRFTRTLLLTTMCLAFSGIVLRGEPSALKPQSKLWIIGDSSLHAWESSATKIDAVVEFQATGKTPSTTFEKIRAGQMSKLDVSIPVNDMKSGKNKLDKNMQKAMNTATYPTIRFHLTNYVTTPGKVEGTDYVIKATGVLSISGTDKTIELEATATATPDGTRIEGRKELLMTDYGVKPTTILMIKTRDRVIVHYDLVLAE